MREEIFGPVLPIVVVDSEQEAIDLANDSEFGLGASVWTKDRQKGERIARRIESGMVWINDHSFSHGACQCAWGGVKDSGVGRSHSKFGFYECVNIKMNAWEPGLTRDFWWHPYDRTLGEAVQASAKILYGKGASGPRRCAKAPGRCSRSGGGRCARSVAERRSRGQIRPGEHGNRAARPAPRLRRTDRAGGCRPDSRRRRDAARARPERGRQDDPAADPRHAAAAERRRGRGARVPAAAARPGSCAAGSATSAMSRSSTAT